jgi:hypothetical protein
MTEHNLDQILNNPAGGSLITWVFDIIIHSNF